MSIGNLPPRDSNIPHTPAGKENTPRTSKDNTKQQAALNALANTANTTAEDNIFSQKEVAVTDQGILGGMVSSVASFFAPAARAALNYAVAAVPSSIVQGGVRSVAYYALPPPGIYAEKIGQLKDSLFTMTGASIASEAAKAIAKGQIYKFSYFLSNLHVLTEADTKTGSLKKFIAFQDGKIVLTQTGSAFLGILKDHTPLLEETFEVNILRAMHNGISTLKKLQAEHPFLAVELIQDTLHHILNETQSPKAAATVEATADEHDRFMNSLCKNVEKVIFPGGAAEIEIPTYFQEFLSKNLFLEIQQKTLPRKMAVVYDKATSEVMKYKILAKAVQELKTILTTEPGPQKPKEPATTTPKIVYPKESQEKFNKELLRAVKAFFKEIGYKLPLESILLKKIEKQGPKIVEKLLNIDLNALLNQSLQGACQKLSPEGSWKKEDGKDVFTYVPTSPKSRPEREEAERVSLAQNQKEVKETIATIASDLDGLISRIAAPKAKKKHTDTSQVRTNKIQTGLTRVLTQIKKGLIRFAFMVFGVNKRISSLSEKVLTFAEKLDLKKASGNIKSLNFKQRVSKPKSPPHTQEPPAEPLF